MKVLIVPLLLSLVVCSSFVYADKVPSYSYVEAGYVTRDFDDGLDSKGIKVVGSYEINSNIFILADLTSTSGDSSDEDGVYDIDLDSRYFGVGFKHDQSDGLSWYATYTIGEWEFDETDTYINGDIDTYSYKLDVDSLTLGARAQFSDNLELNISISSNDIEFLERENGYQFGLVYSTDNQWQFVFDSKIIAGDIDVSTTSFGIRRSF